MRSLSSAFVVAVFSMACHSGALAADAGRGRALYENHCVVCHTAKVHRREPRMAADSAQLYRIVNGWQAEQGLRWSREEIDDVVDYLARTYYKY